MALLQQKRQAERTNPPDTQVAAPAARSADQFAGTNEGLLESPQAAMVCVACQCGLRCGHEHSQKGLTMHELSITQSIVDVVSEYTAGAPVAGVHLRIGKLSGVVADSVRFCFDLVTAGTALASASLVIDEPAGAGHCRTCGSDLELVDLILLCPCGSADVDVISGRELTVQSIEVV